MIALNLEHDPYPGFGNQVIFISQYYRWCKLNAQKPIIYTKTPEKVYGIKKDLFEFVTEKPNELIDPPCTLPSLFNIKTLGYMNKVIDIPDIKIPDNIEAGFCFRIGDSEFDNELVFMNETCIEKMCDIMKQFKKVFVCSNKNSFVETLIEKFGNDKIFTLNKLGDNLRFNNSGLCQWSALSKCPLIFHHVKTIGGPSNEITTTFAPTAGVYGGCEIIGVDNNGNIFQTDRYHW